MIFTLHYDRMHRRVMISLWTQQELISNPAKLRRTRTAAGGTTRILCADATD